MISIPIQLNLILRSTSTYVIYFIPGTVCARMHNVARNAAEPR